MSMTKKLILTGICAAVILLLSNYAFAADSYDGECGTYIIASK